MQVSKTLIEKTAAALKLAAAEIDCLNGEVDSLKSQCARQDLVILAKERSARSVKLAELMYKKGMISKEEIISETDKIMKMDDSSFSALNQVVERQQSESSSFDLKDEDKENTPVKTSLEKTATILSSIYHKAKL